MNDILSIFLPVPDLREYVDSRLASGALAAGRYVKSACVRAVPGTPGERVVTVLKNGLEETVNTVGTDPGSGEPDWIVTGAGGERYIVTDKVFREKYRPSPDEEGVFLPAGKPADAVRICENIRFTAPWGEEQFLAAGGFVILDPGGYYGVAEEEFLETYREA